MIHHWGNQGSSSRQDSEAGTLEEHSLLACSQAHIQLPFLNSPTHLSRDGSAHSGKALLHQLANKTKPHSHAHRMPI